MLTHSGGGIMEFVYDIHVHVQKAYIVVFPKLALLKNVFLHNLLIEL